MTARRTYRQLDEPLADVVRLAAQVDRAVEQATAALRQRDCAFAQLRLTYRAAIDEAQRAMQAEAQNLTRHQALMAGDPHATTTMRVVVRELERISQHVETLAENVSRSMLSTEVSAELLHSAERAQQMLRVAVQVAAQCDEEPASPLTTAATAGVPMLELRSV